MTTYELAKVVWESCVDTEEFTRDGYSAQDAACDIEIFRVSGWELPDGITPEELADAVNDVFEESYDAE